MPLEESNDSYVIIRHNVRTYRSSGVVEVIKSRDEAEALLMKFEEWQTSAGPPGWLALLLRKVGLEAWDGPDRSHPSSPIGISDPRV